MAMLRGLVVRVEPLAGLGIELDQPDVAEIRAVDQPQPAVRGIEKDARDRWHCSPRRRRTRRRRRRLPICSRGNSGSRVLLEIMLIAALGCAPMFAATYM